MLALAHTKAASRSLRTHGDDGRAREVGPLRSTAERAERCPGTVDGGAGGKEADQGELAEAYRGPDAAPDRHAQRARASTASGKTGQQAAVHRAPPPRLQHRAPARGILRREARRGRGRRWGNVAALRSRPGGQSPGPLAAAEARGVPGQAGASRVHSEDGRAAAAARRSHAGRTKSSSAPSSEYWARFTKRTSSGSRMASGLGAARTGHWTRSPSVS